MYCFILNYLIFSFSHNRSLFVPYAYVSVESIDCIVILSSLAFSAILLNFLVNAICFLLLNFCRDFNINLLLFISSLWFSLKLSTSALFFSSWFILFSSLVAFKQLLKSSFYYTLFCGFCFLTLSIFFCLIHLSLIQLLFIFGHLMLVKQPPMKSLLSICLSVRPSIRPSVCPSLNFLRIGPLIFLILYMMIVDHDIEWLRKKIWRPEFERKGTKSGPKLGFLPFSHVWFISFPWNCIQW